jgi:hypothetical protein
MCCTLCNCAERGKDDKDFVLECYNQIQIRARTRADTLVGVLAPTRNLIRKETRLKLEKQIHSVFGFNAPESANTRDSGYLPTA